MKFTPRSYQQDIIDFVAANKRSFIIAAAGAGKTSAVLSGIDPSDKTLIVAPLRVAKHTWPDEIKKWDFGLSYSSVIGPAKVRQAALKVKASVYIINVDNLVWLLNQQIGFDHIIIDESSMFKSPSSKRFKETRKWLRNRGSVKVTLMTATPAPNTLMDTWAQMALLDDGQRLGRSFSGFRSRYYESDYMGYQWTPKLHAAKAIKDKIAEVATVVENYAGLPDLVELTEYVDMPDAAWSDYEQMKKDALLEFEDEDISAANAAVVVGKLAQIAAGAVYDDQRNVRIYHDAKIEALKDIVATTNDNILVAYSWQHDAERIRKALPNAVDIKEDGAIDRWNAGKVKLLLAHPKSAGHGLNLQDGGRRIVWFNPTWSNELKIQFDARLYRQGQSKTVFVHTIMAQGTIDEDVLEAQKNKWSLQKMLIDAVKKARNAV